MMVSLRSNFKSSLSLTLEDVKLVPYKNTKEGGGAIPCMGLFYFQSKLTMTTDVKQC